MDFKKIKRTLFTMVAIFIVIVGALAYANLDTVKQKLGLSADGQTVETALMEDAEAAGGQRGDNLSAFLQDETFFDPEVKFKSIETYSGRSVFLMMSSVAKDLRVMVVDSVGQLVTGTPFTVTVQGVGEYTDTDKDGIIYIVCVRESTAFHLRKRKDLLSPTRSHPYR